MCNRSPGQGHSERQASSRGSLGGREIPARRSVRQTVACGCPVSPATSRGPQPVRRRTRQIRSCSGADKSRGCRCGLDDRSSRHASVRRCSSVAADQRRHHLHAAVGDTPRPRAACRLKDPGKLGGSAVPRVDQLMPRRGAAADTRLRPQRDDQPLRGARRRLRQRDRRDDATASRRGVPALPQSDRQVGAGRARRAPGARQLLDPQDAVDPALARPPPALTLHFTPTYSSWLNLLERWFAELTTKWIKRGTHRSVRDLVASIRTWIAHWNENPKPFVWHKTADEILDSLAAYCKRINDSAH
jgi:hypothetical protein